MLVVSNAHWNMFQITNNTLWRKMVSVEVRFLLQNFWFQDDNSTITYITEVIWLNFLFFAEVLVHIYFAFLNLRFWLAFKWRMADWNRFWWSISFDLMDQQRNCKIYSFRLPYPVSRTGHVSWADVQTKLHFHATTRLYTLWVRRFLR